MSHCAVCGRSSVRSTQESDGYSYKKGIAGTLVFGVIYTEWKILKAFILGLPIWRSLTSPSG